VRVLLTHGIIDVKPLHNGGFVVLPLAVLRQILRDADDKDSGRDLAWQFLEELCYLPPQLDAVLPAAMEDLWAYWLRYGGLLPGTTGPDVSGHVLLVTPTLYDPLWQRAAALDNVAALADKVGLPDINLMPSVHAESPGRATIWGPMGASVVALAEPAVAVTGEIATVASVPQADPAVMAALVISLRDALADSGLGTALAGREGVYRLQVTLAEPLTRPGSADPVPARLQGQMEDGWELTLSFDVLRKVVMAPAEVHTHVGRWLTTPQVDRPGVSKALERWNHLPPFLTLDSYRRAGQPAPPGAWMEPTIASQNRAARSAAAAVAFSDRLPPGRHTGPAALHFCKHVLLPATLNALHDNAGCFDGPAALRAAVRAADAAHAERATRRRAIEIGLATAHADAVRRIVLSSPDGAALTRPAELLVEELLAQTPAPGNVRPDRFDVADMTALARCALDAGVGGDLATRDMGTVTVIADDQGGLALQVRSTQPAGVEEEPDDTSDNEGLTGPAVASTTNAVSTAEWLAASQAEGLMDPALPDVIDPADIPYGTTETAFRPILSGRGLPGRLLTLDQVMRNDLGWGIESMVAVLATAASYEDDCVPQMPPSQLVAEAASYSHRPQTELLAAISFLTLRAREVAENRRFWEQERRPHRLFLRPLVELPSGDLLVPRHLVRALQEVMADMLGEGRLVWPDLPVSVDRAANELRAGATAHLERLAAQAVDETGLPYRANLEERVAADAGSPGLPDEVDLLVCDERAGLLWVIEVKHHIASASPYSITQRAGRFLKPMKGYLSKLRDKTRHIQQYSDQAAQIACGHPVQRPADGWRVRPLMATLRIEPAAFAVNGPHDIPFVLVNRLGQHLAGDEQSYGVSDTV
jgi:hypothetical protein